VIRDFLAPRLKGQEIAAPGPISELFSFVRGHPMAKAGIEMAVLDLFGKAQNRPIYQILGGERMEIPTGVSLGIEESSTPRQARGRGDGPGLPADQAEDQARWDVDVVAEIRNSFPTFR
jgi:O-succinylbenzoate synthase